jgi:fission process protein 1
LKAKRSSGEEDRDEGERFQKALKGTVATTLALTQVLGNALAVHNQDLVQPLESQRSVATAETSSTLATLPSRSRTVVGNASVGQLALAAPSLSIESISSPTVAEGLAAAKEVDLYRDTFVRYAGYANEVGESFKNLIPRASYKMSYAVAICYVLADATDKGLKAENNYSAIAAEQGATKGSLGEGNQGKNSSIEVVKASVDTLIWQSLASVIIPGFTINRIVWASKKLMDSEVLTKIPGSAKKWAPTIIGLSFIPFIVHPIDEGVTRLLDMTIRQFY